MEMQQVIEESFKLFLKMEELLVQDAEFIGHLCDVYQVEGLEDHLSGEIRDNFVGLAERYCDYRKEINYGHDTAIFKAMGKAFDNYK
jgi:hypothetical protein